MYIYRVQKTYFREYLWGSNPIKTTTIIKFSPRPFLPLAPTFENLILLIRHQSVRKCALCLHELLVYLIYQINGLKGHC